MKRPCQKHPQPFEPTTKKRAPPESSERAVRSGKAGDVSEQGVRCVYGEREVLARSRAGALQRGSRVEEPLFSLLGDPSSARSTLQRKSKKRKAGARGGSVNEERSRVPTLGLESGLVASTLESAMSRDASCSLRDHLRDLGKVSRGYVMRHGDREDAKRFLDRLEECLKPDSLSKNPLHGSRPPDAEQLAFVPLCYRHKGEVWVPPALGLALVGLPQRDCRNEGAAMLGPDSAEARCAHIQLKTDLGQPQALDTVLDAWGSAPYYSGTLVLPCGFGKTVVALAAVASRGRCACVLTHKRKLADQWCARVRQYLPWARVALFNSRGADSVLALLGQPGAAASAPFDVCVASIQTLYSRIRHSAAPSQLSEDLVGDIMCSRAHLSSNMAAFLSLFGTLVFDEAHHLAARTFCSVVALSNARCRLGLSATPNRPDGLSFVLLWYLGPFLTPGSSSRPEHVLPKHASPDQTLPEKAPPQQGQAQSGSLRDGSAQPEPESWAALATHDVVANPGKQLVSRRASQAGSVPPKLVRVCRYSQVEYQHPQPCSDPPSQKANDARGKRQFMSWRTSTINKCFVLNAARTDYLARLALYAFSHPESCPPSAASLASENNTPSETAPLPNFFSLTPTNSYAAAQVLVLSERIALLEAFQKRLRAHCPGVFAHIIRSAAATRSRASKESTSPTPDFAPPRTTRFYLTTYQLGSEALDFPCLNCLFMITPKTNPDMLKQVLGRINRPASADLDGLGTRDLPERSALGAPFSPWVVDVCDTNLCDHFNSHAPRRRSCFRELSFKPVPPARKSGQAPPQRTGD